MKGLISYIDSNSIEWSQFSPGSRWKILFEDPKTGQRAILVQWEPGYRMGQIDHHERDEIVFVLSGTFVQNGRASGPGTYIHQRAGSQHQASTPDGCTFIEIVTGQQARRGRATRSELLLFSKLAACVAETPPNPAFERDCAKARSPSI